MLKIYLGPSTSPTECRRRNDSSPSDLSVEYNDQHIDNKAASDADIADKDSSDNNNNSSIADNSPIAAQSALPIGVGHCCSLNDQRSA